MPVDFSVRVENNSKAKMGKSKEVSNTDFYQTSPITGDIVTSIHNWNETPIHIVIHFRVNPLYTNGVFLLVGYNKLWKASCIYLGVSDYNFKKNVFFSSDDLFHLN